MKENKKYFVNQNSNGKAHWLKIAGSLIFVSVIASLLTHVWDINSGFQEPTMHKISLANSNYKFIKPLLAFEVGEKKEFVEYKPLEQKIINIESQAKSNGDANIVSMYFRDLTTGRWMGWRESETFSPGSLLKVPLMITYFKEGENNPGILSKKIDYATSTDLNLIEKIKPSKTIQPGKSYTISELIQYMIVYSDNNATQLLFNNINYNSLNEIYFDLGINYPENPTTADIISAKQYSLFFRTLYNATYLNSSNSETALQLLSQAGYKDGIVAGLPDNTLAAHKFGEREIVDPVNGHALDELHDCGIVYYPNHPYFLCIMTKGGNLQKLQGVIKSISSAVYSDVDKQSQK